MTDMQPISGPPGDDVSSSPGDGAGGGFDRQPPAPSLRAAESVRDGLASKLEAAKVALDELDVHRREISYSAHVEGGLAKKELDALNKSRVTQQLDVENLEVALAEAGRRVADAEREAEDTALSERAARAMVIAGGLVERGKRLDEALKALADEAAAFKDDIRELNFEIGCGFPHEFQFESLGSRAVKAALMQSPFKIEHIAPGERHNFVELCEGWVATINRWAEARLPAKEDAA